MEAPLITILCPVYNEDRVVPLFFERIQPVLVKLSEHYAVHLVFLNNASRDRTPQQIEKIRSLAVDVSHHHEQKCGLHASLECGLRNAAGDLFVFIDVDCEDPPEMILEFVEKYEQGYDIVYGERVDRDESKAMKRARKFFYRLLRR